MKKKYWAVIVGLFIIFKLKIDFAVSWGELNADYWKAFGNNYWSIRLPTMLGGLFLIYLFNKFLVIKKENIYIRRIAVLILVSLPLFIYVSLFNFWQIWGLNLLLLILIYKRQKKINYINICMILGLVIVLFRSEIINMSFLSVVTPKSYGYLIERRIAYGFVSESPLIYKDINFNRIGHNKINYSVRSYFEFIEQAFDFEEFSASRQANTILTKELGENSVVYPKLYFWQIPIVFYGTYLMIRNRKLRDQDLTFVALVGIVIFSSNGLFLALPILTLLIATGIFSVVIRTKQWSLVVVIILLYLFSASLVDMVKFHYWESVNWIANHDLVEESVWRKFEIINKDYDTVFVTDRFSDAQKYYDFYINGEDNLVVKSIKYYESPRAGRELWIGTEDEIIGNNKKYKSDEDLIDARKLEEILSRDGRKILIIETTL